MADPPWDEFISATANETLVLKCAAAGTLSPLGFQASGTNSGKLLFVGGAIMDGTILLFPSILPYSPRGRKRIGEFVGDFPLFFIQPLDIAGISM